MTGEAKTGARIRPIGGSGIVNAGAGSEKVRAAGGKGFAMLGNAGSHGRSQVARVPTGGGPARIYVCGESNGPTFCGITTGNIGSQANAVVFALDLDGTFLWAWSDGLSASIFNSATAIAADATGCYVAHQGTSYAWSITKLSPAGAFLWNVPCGTTSYSPLHIEVRGGYLYAVGLGDRNLWMIEATTGAVVAHVTGYDVGIDPDVEGYWNYRGTVAASTGGTAYAANAYEGIAADSGVHSRGLRYGSGGIEAADGFYLDMVSPSSQHDVKAVGLPGAVWGLWVTVWGAQNWVNEWDSGYIYAAGDVVTWGVTGSHGWVSLANANQGHDPTTSPTWWREWDYGYEPIEMGFFLSRRAADFSQVDVPITLPGGAATIHDYALDTVPAVDMTSGLIVTNVYDPAGDYPKTLTAFDTNGTELWSVADGVYFTGAAAAVAAGSSRVVVASTDGSFIPWLDILSPADGSRLVAQFTVGDDSTTGYTYRSVAIG